MITIQGINKLTDIIIKKTEIWKDMPEGTSKYLSSALYFALNNLSFNSVWWPNHMYTSVHIWPGMFTTLAFTYKEEGLHRIHVSFSFDVSCLSGKYKMTLYDNNKRSSFFVQAGKDPILKQLFKSYYKLNRGVRDYANKNRSI